MPGPNDPNDPQYKNDPANYVFVNGRWQKKTSGGQEAASGPTAAEFAQGYYVDSKGRKIPLSKPGESTHTTARESSAFGGFNNAMQTVLGNLGLIEGPIKVDAAGADLETVAADDDRMRLGSLLGQLQQQAATGGGAWEGSLKDSTDKAASSVQALGQSQPGVNYASALRNVGNAQGAVAQRAVGQGNIVREQSKLDAQDQISGILGGQGAQDAQQAAEEASARAGRRAANAALAEKAGQVQGQIIQGAAQTAGSLAGMSDGGEVPGRAKVFGDDSRNDTVRAKLSPGEIVIPRSHADSPEAAANFVRALQAQKQRPLHFDSGGQVPDDNAATASPVKGSDVLFSEQEQAPSIENGGLLDPTQFNQTRTQNINNQALLAQRAAGGGPSVVPQMQQNAVDANIAAGMQAGVKGANPSEAVALTGEAVQEGGARAVAQKAQEQAAGQQGLARSIAGLRGADLGMSSAAQQAAWRNTLLNSGVGIAQANQLRALLGGAGQAATAFASGASKSSGRDSDSSGLSDVEQSSNYDESSRAADKAFDEDFWTGGFVQKPKKYADGGTVADTRAADFVRALRMQR